VKVKYHPKLNPKASHRATAFTQLKNMIRRVLDMAESIPTVAAHCKETAAGNNEKALFAQFRVFC